MYGYSNAGTNVIYPSQWPRVWVLEMNSDMLYIGTGGWYVSSSYTLVPTDQPLFFSRVYRCLAVYISFKYTTTPRRYVRTSRRQRWRNQDADMEWNVDGCLSAAVMVQS